MRVPRTWIPIISGKVINSLIGKGFIEPKIPLDQLRETLEEIIIDELMVEDRLNEEVREILKQHERDIEGKRLDYKRLFDMTKQKLVRERNLIL